jgi:hypothetical protein
MRLTVSALRIDAPVTVSALGVKIEPKRGLSSRTWL